MTDATLLQISPPTFTGGETTEAKVQALTEHIYMLEEQLRYILQALGPENFSEAGLKDLKKALEGMA